MEALKQPQFAPFAMEEQAALIYIAVHGFLMKTETKNVPTFARNFLAYLKAQNPEILLEIADKREISIELEQSLKNAAEKFIEYQKKQGLQA
jgi:F-type H+-transporting ATPase subunit alpha